jgi:D-3-phosphoglycerate dehydrogenase
LNFFLDCPVDFLKQEEIKEIFETRKINITTKPNKAIVLVVNPGTSSFLSKKYFEKFEMLKIVCTPSTGVNHLDTKYLDSRGIKYYCLLDDMNSLENIHASAEFTWIHIMNLYRKFSKSIKSVNQWRCKENESKLRSKELHEKSLGIVGMGRIGNKIVRYAEAFGLKVFYYDPYSKCKESKNAQRVKYLSELETMDIISINCYLTKETEKMITFGVWDNVKPETVVVNTSRGEVVDEDYISYLIKKNKIRYGCDVLCGETNLEKLRNSSILNLSKIKDDVIVTPHVAGATIDSQRKALISVIDLSLERLNNV